MVEILLFFMNAAKYYILRFFKVAKRFIMDPFDKPRREKNPSALYYFREEREKNAYKSFILKKDGLDAWANDCLNYDEIKFGYIYPGERNKGDKTFL